MSDETLQILFLGELPVWLRISQAIVSAPGAAIQVHRSASLRDALRCLAAQKWDAVLLDIQHPPAKQLLSALRLHSVFHAVPAIALVPQETPALEASALSAGAVGCLAVQATTASALQEATLAAINNKKSFGVLGKGPQMPVESNGAGSDIFPVAKIDVISHALNNLLCVINANADVLADQVDGSQHAARSVDQIKKAAKNAAELMRQLKSL
jgi:CheY-like chemotaxis protein